MKLVACSSFILVSLAIQAQSFQNITLSGIISAPSPVESADCFLKNNEHVGTLTNASGYFQISFPESMLYDTLVIWAMGFEKKEVPLSSIDHRQDSVYFYLDQQSIVLGEVVIEADGLDLKGMVLKALASIPNNYPRKRHQLTGLYRKVSTDGSQFTHLEEAAIVVEDNGYGKSSGLPKIKTEQYRQTKDWGNIDSLHLARYDKMHRTIAKQLSQPTNPLHRLYATNGIRHYNAEHNWFNLTRSRKVTINELYTIQLLDVSINDGDTVYHLAFASSVRPPPPRQVSGRNYLKINATDFGIVEMQFTLGFDNEPLMNQMHVQFQKISGKYYPKYIRNISSRHINSGVDDNEYDIHTFAFDEVKREDFQRIKSSEAIDPNDPLSHHHATDDPAFWDGRSMNSKHPLEQSIKNDLEKHGPLEQQFRENRDQ